MEIKFLKRNFIQRLLGLPLTSKPADPGCWRYAKGDVTIDLAKAPELKTKGGAIRLEGKELPLRLLVVAGDDGQFHAYQNRCTHLGHRRLDPVPGTSTVQCCSVNKSTYDSSGQKIFGPAPNPIKKFPISGDENQLIINVN